jgi:hypothetical protein
MSFRPEISQDLETSEPPTAEELRILRELDPTRIYLK